MPEILFTENETNLKKFYGVENESPYVKDAFHEYIINGKKEAVNPAFKGTKVALHYQFQVEGNSSEIFYFHFYRAHDNGTIDDQINRKEIEKLFYQRITEADLFYQSIYDEQLIHTLLQFLFLSLLSYHANK